jgi:hypothetical protein
MDLDGATKSMRETYSDELHIFLSRRDSKTLKKIFQESPQCLWWDDELQPLLEALKKQIGGSHIPKYRWTEVRSELLLELLSSC